MPREREFGGGGSESLLMGCLIYYHQCSRYRSSDEIKVFTKDGNEYDAEILGADKGTDLALIKIDSDEKLPEITLGDSDSVRVGDSVVGAPFGLSQTVTLNIQM